MKKFFIFVLILFTVNWAMAQWLPLNSGTNSDLTSVYFTARDTGYVGGHGGKILKTVDGGNNWIPQTLDPNDVISSIFFPDNNIGFAVSRVGTIFRTTDGGDNWMSVYATANVSFTSVYFTDVDTGYVVGGDYILKTTDGGVSWSLNDFGFFREGFESVFFTDNDTGYVIAVGWTASSGPWGTVFYQTTDGGISWTITDTMYYLAFYDLTFYSKSVGYAFGYSVIGEGCSIAKTIDGGSNWNISTGMDGGILLSGYFPNETNGYAVGGLILHTEDGGETWIKQFPPTTEILYSVHFPASDTGYIVGENGTILKTTNGGYPLGVDNQSSNSIPLNVYPNPSSYEIIFETAFEGHLSIINFKGQVLLQQTISKPSTQIDIAYLPVGIYFIRFVNENAVQVEKLIKQ